LGTGALPAILNTVSSDSDMTALREYNLGEADFQTGAPFTPVKRTLTLEHTTPWAITVDESAGWLYYTCSGFSEPIGGTTDQIRRHNLNTGVNELFATLTLQGTNNPGLKGLQFVFGVGVFVCNGTVSHLLNSSGQIVQTYTPSNADDHQSTCDIKISADGQSVYVVDENTTRITKFNVSTGAEEDSWQPWLLQGTLCQMAIYQPTGVTLPPEAPCVLERPKTSCWISGPAVQSVRSIAQTPTRPRTSTWNPTHSPNVFKTPLAETNDDD
jgi:hypothetical protein